MPEYLIEFAATCVAIRHPESIADLLDVLFADLRVPVGKAADAVLDIAEGGPCGSYTLADAGCEAFFQGKAGTHLAAALFDQVIQHLIGARRHGVALHAAAVRLQGRTMLLPGSSGAGKSSMTAWLTAAGCSYLTDELVFLPDDGCTRVIPFPRPLCIKAGAAAAVKALLPPGRQQDILEDELGLMIPHRLLNPAFSPSTSAPDLLLFPCYQADSPLRRESLSGAKCLTLLMSCDVNGRNLDDHGFRQLAGLARSVPAWQVSYGSFSQLPSLLADLVAQPCGNQR